MTAEAITAPRERLIALDVFRGLTVASMLLVNNPGSWSAIYAPLGHAPWHGWTPTDLIFPFFLFIVGITTALSKKEPRQILKRGGLIILLGLLLNAFPFFWWGKMAGNADPSFLDRVVWRFSHLRFPGVLQRIGIVYICAALIASRTTRRQQIGIIAAILIGYWLLLTIVPVPGTGTVGALLIDQPSQTLAAWTDRLLIGENHLWSSTKTWDPEGPLSTLPAIATAMLGILTGAVLLDRDRSLTERLVSLFGWGSVGMLTGWLWSAFFPINKNLWTSSYVLFTAGFAAISLATCVWLIDLRGSRRWTKPFVIYGVNPLVAFVGSGIMARSIGSLIKVGEGDARISLQQWVYKSFFAQFFVPKFASLLFALAFVAFWLGILAILHRRGWILRV